MPCVETHNRDNAVSITLPQNLNYKMPAVCIQFDDSLASHYTKAFAYMNPKGMKGTCYIISPPFQNLTDAQMIEMDAAGWDMGNHTTTPATLPTMSLEDQTTAISSQKTLLDGLGLTRASSHVTYPSGLYNADTLTAMSNLGMLTGKIVGDSRESFRYISSNPYLIPIHSIIASTSTADAIDWIESCLCEKSVPTILWHDIVDSGASGIAYNYDDFCTIINWIEAQRLPTLTISQVYSLMSGSIEYTTYW